MKKNILLTIFLCFNFLSVGLVLPITATANPTIVAVVDGNYVILSTDIEQKKNFLSIATINANFTKDEIIGNVITTYLINKDAKRFNITLTPQEYQNGLQNLLLNKNISETELFKKLKELNISQETFKTLLTDELLAEKTKQYIATGGMTASPSEITSEINKFLSLNGKSEFLLMEITLLSENQAQELYPLVNDKNFADYAKRYSSTYSALTNGVVGWIPEIYLHRSVLENIKQSGINTPTPVTKVGNKYKIYLVKEVRGMLQVNPSNPQHLEQLEQIAKQKIIFEKSQAASEDYVQDLYKRSSITLYNYYD